MLLYSTFILPRPFSPSVCVHSWQERSHSCRGPPLCDRPVRRNSDVIFSDVMFMMWTHVKSVKNRSHWSPNEKLTGTVINQEVVVALTHQWVSLAAVTTMISSLKKASCSELTALQSTKALTRFWCGLLPETWRRHDIFYSVPPANLYWLWNLTGLFWFSTEKEEPSGTEVMWYGGLKLSAKYNRKRFLCDCTMAFLRGRGAHVTVGEDDGAGAGAAVRPGLLPTKLQYSSSWLPTQLGDSTPHFPWLPPPLLVRRYDVVFSELEEGGEVTWNEPYRTRPLSYGVVHKHITTEDSWITISTCVALKTVLYRFSFHRLIPDSIVMTEMCRHIVAMLPHLTGPMWFWEDVGVTLLWDPELAPGCPSQGSFCPLSRPPCPWGDLGGLPPCPWFSVLGEGVVCLASVWGLEEWEGGLEQRRGSELPSCVVTEIWGSERPAEGEENEDRNYKSICKLLHKFMLML